MDTAHLAEDLVKDAVQALLDGNEELAKEVMARDEELDQLEIEVDALCIRLLARRAPVAGDLRLVTCALKMVTDMERMGDLASNIAKREVRNIGEGENRLPIPEVVAELAELTLALIRRAIEAMELRDATVAREVRHDDRRLDKLNRKTFKRMIEHGRNDPEHLDQAIAWTSVSRHLERIGDHAVNIAEMVVYLVEGKVVKHTPTKVKSASKQKDKAADPA
jgi:phosphate transport system protein